MFDFWGGMAVNFSAHIDLQPCQFDHNDNKVYKLDVMKLDSDKRPKCFVVAVTVILTFEI